MAYFFSLIVWSFKCYTCTCMPSPTCTACHTCMPSPMHSMSHLQLKDLSSHQLPNLSVPSLDTTFFETIFQITSRGRSKGGQGL